MIAYSEAQEEDKEALYEHLGPIPMPPPPSKPVQTSIGGGRRILPVSSSWDRDAFMEFMLLGMRESFKQ